MDRVILSNIDYLAIRHPDDRKGIDWLNNLRYPQFSFDEFKKEIGFSKDMPLMEQLKEWGRILKDSISLKTFPELLSATTSKYREAYNEIENQGEGINITFESLSGMHQQLLEACRILNIKDIPEYSTDWDFGPYHYSCGQNHRRIVMMSGSVDLFEEDEMLFTLGHELGHMVCNHKPYHMLLECFYLPFINEGAFRVWASIIKLPLFEWYRTSDYSADRVGLLCCQDINAALRTMIKKAGLPMKCYDKIDIESFKKQAIEFETNYAGFYDKTIKALSIRSSEFPWLVVRAAKLLQWYESDEYRQIINNN